MKIWMRLLAGAAIGILLGTYLPESGGDTTGAFVYLSRIVVHIGRYALFPLMLFSVISGILELRQDNLFLRVYIKAAGLMAATTIALILLGTLSTLVFSPDRIPPIFQETAGLDLPDTSETIFRVIPRNLFSVITGNGNELLPVYVLALILGLVLSFEGIGGEALSGLSESLAGVFYRVNALVTEVIGIGFIALSGLFILRIRTIPDFDIFAPLLLVLVIVTVIVVFGIYPLLLYLLGERRNPYTWLYTMIAPALAGFFSGDAYFSLGVLLRIGRENMGLPRLVRSPVFGLAAIFGRAGTAMVMSASFIVILQSYTALEITVSQVIWIMTSAFFTSLMLGSVPGTGVPVGLAMMAASYERGMEEIFLILQPTAPILIAIGVFLDIMTTGFIGYLIATTENVRTRIDPIDFV
jgi:Na+/H+-dicarboxylate symporter